MVAWLRPLTRALLYLLLINVINGANMETRNVAEKKRLFRDDSQLMSEIFDSNEPVAAARNEPPTLAKTCSAKDSDFMGFLENILKTQNDLVDHFRNFPEQFLDEVDFVVVGSGSAGSVVAARLSEVYEAQRAPWKVLLLEAGGPAPTAASVPSLYFNYPNSSIDWNFKLQEEKYAFLPGGFCYWPRGKVFGGTSVLNGMMYMRGHRKDYDGWQVPGWSWKDVLPFFLLSEDNRDIGTPAAKLGFHGRGGPMTVQRFPDQPKIAWNILEAAQELGFSVGGDLNAESQIGFTVAQAMQRGGVRLTSSKAFLEPALHRKNLQVLLNAMVTRVIIDPGTKRAFAVEYEHKGVIRVVRARKEIILCAGAVQSPQLLMLSGVGPADHLKEIGVPVLHDLPGVGYNLQNHVSVSVTFRIRGQRSKTLLDFDAIRAYLLGRKGPMSSTGMSQLTGFVQSTPGEDGDRPDLQIFFEGYNANSSSTGDSQEVDYEGDRLLVMVPTLLRPGSTGTVRLRSKDPWTPPSIVANYLRNKDDLRRLRKGIRLVTALAESRALKRARIKLDLSREKECSNHFFDSDEYWDCVIRHRTNPENHQCGTCSMGPINGKMAVLDPKLRVRGIRRLRVIDASSMPRVPSCNIAAPVTMIAERGAHFIAQYWLRQEQRGSPISPSLYYF